MAPQVTQHGVVRMEGQGGGERRDAFGGEDAGGRAAESGGGRAGRGERGRIHRSASYGPAREIGASGYHPRATEKESCT